VRTLIAIAVLIASMLASSIPVAADAHCASNPHPCGYFSGGTGEISP
jgi:uncharacterized protein (DUF2062 family)